MGWQDNFWWNSNIADWIGGIGTIGALFFAGYQVRSDRQATRAANDLTARSIAQTDRALEQQTERDRLDTDSRLRAQAALISCHASHDAVHPASVDVVYHNHSAVPIFDARSFVCTKASVTSSPDTEAVILEPGKWTTRTFPGSFNTVAPAGQFAGVAFRDNAGVNWIKWGDGILLRGTIRDISLLSPTDSKLPDGNPEADPRHGYR